MPRRLGRLARGFVINLQDDARFRDAMRAGRERGETLRDTFGGAFEAAWRGAAEEWQAAQEERERRETGEAGPAGERTTTGGGSAGAGPTGGRGDYGSWRTSSTTFRPRRYPPEVVTAYNKLGLIPGANLEDVSRKRRDLVKRYHPDRFTDPDKRARAERKTAEINAAHDAIARHLLRR